MKLSGMTRPTPETVLEVKRSYNRLLKRQKDAGSYLDNPEVPQEEKEKHILAFRIEIIDPLEAYLQVLNDWGVTVTNDEILGGIHIE